MVAIGLVDQAVQAVQVAALHQMLPEGEEQEPADRDFRVEQLPAIREAQMNIAVPPVAAAQVMQAVPEQVPDGVPLQPLMDMVEMVCNTVLAEQQHIMQEVVAHHLIAVAIGG